MIDKIYIYDNRTNVDFLNQYIKKAKGMGFSPELLAGNNLHDDKRFNEFKSLYKHYSDNSVEFDINCFARYFAIAAIHEDDKMFILSDSDVYITDKVLEIKNNDNIKDVFVGSEGFFRVGSELQISPHFSIWNKQLVNDFVDYIVYVYKKNSEKDFLEGFYIEQKKKLGRTGISDMTLLYMWVKERNIPFINSNDCNNELGIDHNISSLLCSNGEYKSFLGRKAVRTTKDNGVFFHLKNGQKQEIAVVHFQGGYKRILNEFYNGNFAKFRLFTYYIRLGRFINKIVKK